jgi:aryl-alcohol dehydrogenase-like predicted oxidoreductase
MRRIGTSDLHVFPLALGGNTFGWTANEAESFDVLDAYAAAGGNFVDTADVYSAWVPGNVGGESETILGRWMKERSNRSRIIVGTKVGQLAGVKGLSAKTVRTAAEASLRRLQTDVIDLYYAHIDDQETSLEETLGAFDALVREGKVRHIAASQYTAPRLADALAVSAKNGFARYVALQTHYSLVHRKEYEGALAELCAREGVSTLPFFALARGFLTGKYRPGKEIASARAAGAKELAGESGWRVLEPLDEIAAAHRTTVSAVALAWTAAQKGVAVPLASARTRAQLADLLPYVELVLSEAELARLTEVSNDIG